MANNLVIRALRAKAKSLNLSSRNLKELFKDGVKLPQVLELHVNNNLLRTLPVELQCMWQLTVLNLGNNTFEEMPEVLKNLHSLKKLYLFGNQISTLNVEVLESLSNLVLLNLNHNKIKLIPPAIKSLSNLERFSIADNQLEEIPAEFGLVSKLTEINLSRNKLSEIPQELYKLIHLRKLSLARNSLKQLPEGINGWKNLKTLDIAGNHLSMFPVNELAARVILKEHLNKSSVVSRASLLLPDVHAMISRFGRCAVCFEPFLTPWVECVQFISLRKDMGIKNSKNIPVRVLLCSSSCFNKSGHSYYSVVKVKP